MGMRSIITLSTLISLVLAAPAPAPAPAPQDIEFGLVYALPEPTYSIDPLATAQVVTYNPSSVLSAALPQITAKIDDTDAVASSIAASVSAADDNGSTVVQKRAITACQPQFTAAKMAPAVADDPTSFSNSAAFANLALKAITPLGWSRTFVNLKSSNFAYGYLGYTTLDTYDVSTCAARCSNVNGCMSFNIYFERDPSVLPGPSCPNPASVTLIKCAYWGGPVTAANAGNNGSMQINFNVTIAGSNGYQSNSIAAPSGYSVPVFYNSAAINAPLDRFGFDSYMGVALFNSGPFDINLCAKACSMKSQYNLAHPPTDGTPVTTCQFFNTYILYINQSSNVQGQYCAMYGQSWGSAYATNTGQYNGNDHFMIQNSYAVSNITNPGVANPLNAVYQAVRDIDWKSNNVLPYCSIIAVPAASSITKTVATITIAPTTTQIVTVTVTAAPQQRKRGENIISVNGTYTIRNGITYTAGRFLKQSSTLLRKRAVSTPPVFNKYPAAIQISACKLRVTMPTPTVILSVKATTTGGSITSTVVATVSVTTTPTPSPSSTSSSTTITSVLSTFTSSQVLPTSTPQVNVTGSIFRVSNDMFLGQYIYSITDSSLNTTVYTLGSDRSSANISIFNINSTTNGLMSGITLDPVGVQYGPSTLIGSGIASAPVDSVATAGYEQIQCSISQVDQSVSCTSPTNQLNVFAICDWAGNDLVLFDNAQDATDACGMGSILTFVAEQY